MPQRKTKQKIAARDIIAQIAKIDRDLAEYISRELTERRVIENTVIPAYTPTQVGEQPVPTVSTKVIGA